MTDRFNAEERYQYLRSKLDALGFCQALPLSAISLVGSILDDLITTTCSFKKAKEELHQLREEKEAWDLGVEPYKCENSRLLAELNCLHLELMRQRELGENRNLELIRSLRALELDKNYLEEHSKVLEKKVCELQARLHIDVTAGQKSKKDGKNMSNKKPFVSTVRSGIVPKQPPVSASGTVTPVSCCCQKKLIVQENEKLRNDLNNQLDLTETYRRQVDAREREIQRLNNLLVGGRPVAALAKDCCYKGVGTLTDDIEHLQSEKTSIQIQLEESIKKQHEAMERAMSLDEENHNLQQELRELRSVALNVEGQANSKLSERDKLLSELKLKFDQVKQRNRDLERDLNTARQNSLTDFEKINCHTELRKANEEIDNLTEKLRVWSNKEQVLLKDIEILSKKNMKLETKVVALRRDSDAQGKDYENNEKSNQVLTNMLSSYDEEMKTLKSERDYFQRECVKLVDKQNAGEIVLKEKESLIKTLKSELELQKSGRGADTLIGALSNRSVQSTMNRQERELKVLRTDVQRLELERDSLRSKLKSATDAQVESEKQSEKLLATLYDKIHRLEAERSNMISTQVPTEVTVNLMGEEIEELRGKLKDKEHENNQLKIKNSQLKVLLEQTEKNMTDIQKRLAISDQKLGENEQNLNRVNSSREVAQNEAGTLRGDMTVLRAANTALEREKDKLMIELDHKTERIYKLEGDIQELHSVKLQMQADLDKLRQKYEEKSFETLQREGSLRNVTSETATLRKQISTLKIENDSANVEHTRMVAELTELSTDLAITKRKLKDSQKEVDGLKLQLQQYVTEVQRAEDLLAKKDNEREEMLDHYRSLSHDAIVLEGNNQSLEMEAAETKKQLIEAEARLVDMDALLKSRDNEIKTYELQINDLSSQIEKLELEIDNQIDENRMLKADLDATKELCNKLDLQKDKLMEELNEHSKIREHLQQECDRLKSEPGTSGGERRSVASDKVATTIITTSRPQQELSEYASNMNVMNQEIMKLKKQVTELNNKLTEERTNSMRNEALAHEYSVQAQELQHILTTERFERDQIRDYADSHEKSKTSDEIEVSIVRNATQISSTNSSIPDSLKIISSQLSFYQTDTDNESSTSTTQITNENRLKPSVMKPYSIETLSPSRSNKNVRFLFQTQNELNLDLESVQDTDSNLSVENIRYQSTPIEKHKMIIDTTHLEPPPPFDPDKVLIPWSHCINSCGVKNNNSFSHHTKQRI